ncbi:MAG: GtrA family protein [Parcubacteria group bacterium]|nr:GtrA family protein [Parcubacteria group bacterium]
MATKKDIVLAALAGFLIAVFFLSVANNLEEFSVPYLPAILILFPALSAVGIVVASAIARTLPALFQAARFLLVGALNSFIDLGVLNFLIALTGAASGFSYSLFKGTSFLTAVINSYFWNKYWTFPKKNVDKTAWQEFLQFFAVSGLGFVINVGAASFVVNVIGPQFGFSKALWANVGAVVAAFVSLAWNFFGYKLFVFKI